MDEWGIEIRSVDARNPTTKEINYRKIGATSLVEVIETTLNLHYNWSQRKILRVKIENNGGLKT